MEKEQYYENSKGQCALVYISFYLCLQCILPRSGHDRFDKHLIPKFNWHLLINNNSIFLGFNVLSRNRMALFNIFHSLAAFHVSEEIATFGPTPTTTKKDKHKYI